MCEFSVGQYTNSRPFPGSGDGDRCASCRLSLPSAGVAASFDPGKSGQTTRPTPPLRTREDIHVCGVGASENSHEPHDFSLEISVPSPLPHSANVATSCHTHKVQFISTGSPVESKAFSRLRRATIRTLSGEQLPWGQSSGPLLFGDSHAGYTIAYVFRLADSHARGRQRYYALLALAGSDTYRAFEACTTVWAFFEKIASNTIQAAREVASRASKSSPPPTLSQLTPVSSFLTGRSTDPDGFPRNVTNVRANGITELVDNTNFFCELHLAFVRILKDLGKSLSGAYPMTGVMPTLAHRSPLSESRTASRDRKDEEPHRISGESPTKLDCDRPASGTQRYATVPSDIPQYSMSRMAVPSYQRQKALA